MRTLRNKQLVNDAVVLLFVLLTLTSLVQVGEGARRGRRLTTRYSPCGYCDHGSCNLNEPSECICDAHYVTVGSDVLCSIYDEEIEPGRVVNNSVARREWKYYHFAASRMNHGFTVRLDQTSDDGDCDVYLRGNEYPTKLLFDYSDIDLDPHVALSVPFPPSNVTRWYVGVYGFQPCRYNLLLDDSTGDLCNGHGTYNNTKASCTCEDPYYGPSCSRTPIMLEPRIGHRDSVNNSEWKFYQFSTTSARALSFIVNQTTDGDSDLYVNFASLPNFTNYEAKDITRLQNYYVSIADPQRGIYYAGIYGFEACSYLITVKISDECPNQCSHHGACTDLDCVCNSSYTGTRCQTMVPALALGQNVTGYVSKNAWNFYHFRSNTGNNIQVAVSQSNHYPEDCDLYIKQGSEPTTSNYDYRDTSTLPQFILTIEDPGAFTWYIGIYGYSTCTYSLVVNETGDPNTCPNNCSSHGTCSDQRCQCDAGYAGEDCGIVNQELQSGRRVSGNVSSNQWKYYTLNNVVGSVVSVLLHELTNTNSAVLWLYISNATFPTERVNDQFDKSQSKYHQILVHHVPESTDPSNPSVYYIGVYASPFVTSTRPVDFELEAWSSPL